VNDKSLALGVVSPLGLGVEPIDAPAVGRQAQFDLAQATLHLSPAHSREFDELGQRLTPRQQVVRGTAEALRFQSREPHHTMPRSLSDTKLPPPPMIR
jgi:hypothetical protein